jgi:DNA-binding NtrC family response regulator
MSSSAPKAAVSVLQVAYAADMLDLRERMLKEDGYLVTSAMGNELAMEVAKSEKFDIVVVGFSGPHSARHEIVRWLKLHVPRTPVVILLAHEAEHFPDADCETMSENPQVWLAAVRAAAKKP